MIAEKVNQVSLNFAEYNRVRDKVSLFGALSDEQLDRVIPLLKIKSVDDGHIIFNQGQLPCNVYILLSGEVIMRVTRDDGSCGKMIYKVGDCFGETAVIGIQSQLGEARASKDARVMVLSRSNLLDIANSDSEIFGILMMNIAREVSRRLHGVVATSPESDSYFMLRA